MKADAARDDGWRVHLTLVGVQTGFALFPIFGKLALRSIPPMALAAIRVVSAALILAAFHRTRPGGERIARADRGRLLLLAVLGVSANQILFLFGLAFTSAINTGVLIALIPIDTLAVAVLLGQERLNGRAALSIVLGLSGALGIVGAERFAWHDRSFRGNLLLVASGISYSFYLVLSRPVLARYRAATVISAVFLFGAIPIVLAAVPVLRRFEPSSVPLSDWASLAAIVVFCTALPYAWNSWALARTEASRVAFYVFLQPVIASLLAVAVLGERLTVRRAVAATLILSGLAVCLARPRAPAAART